MLEKNLLWDGNHKKQEKNVFYAVLVVIVL